MHKPAPMVMDDALPELRDGLAKQPSLNLTSSLGLWWARTMTNLFVRFAPVPADGVRVSDVPLGTAAVRLYEPQGAASGAGVLWIHGGGLILGNARMSDALCAELVRSLGVVVASVEHRLAPQHPYPAAIDDCFEVWEWFRDNAERLGVDSSRLAVGGQSAGGGLAAALAQRVCDAGGVQPAAQALIYPMLDDRTAADTTLDAVNHLVWNNRFNRVGWASYLGHETGLPDPPPWAVPGRREDLTGLPPAWIGVGTLDLFLKENRDYAERLRAAAVECEFKLVDAAPHGFDIFVPEAEVSREFMADLLAFLRRRLSRESAQAGEAHL